MTPSEVLVLVALAAAALGYAAGRRIGRGQGRMEGLATAPLALRAKALDDGICPVCGHRNETPTPAHTTD